MGIEKDLGAELVANTHEELEVDEPWTVRDDRGFTWWAAWTRQRIWSAPPLSAGGERWWHVRARTWVLRDVVDGPAAYELVDGLNNLVVLGAAVYDAADGTVSVRTGLALADDDAGWRTKWFLAAAGAQVGAGWLAGSSDAAAGLPLDDAPHPVAGRRADPDDILGIAVQGFPSMPIPLPPSVLNAAARMLRSGGVKTQVRDDGLLFACPTGPGPDALAQIVPAEHDAFGDVVRISLTLPTRYGAHRGRWLANALNVAEDADWRGDPGPNALGAWQCRDGRLRHVIWLPSVLVTGLGEESAEGLLDVLISQTMLRARFAEVRLPWLVAAAVGRYPEDTAALAADPRAEDDAGADEADEEEREAFVPWAERSFGTASRTPRPRDPQRVPQPPRELVVDPADPSAFNEVDAAMAEAEDGDRIVVRPGTYRTPVVVDRAVEIAGEGERDRIVLEPVGGECLGFAVSGARVTGLTVRPSRAGNDGTSWSAVALHNVEATVERCRLSTHLGATVWVGGPQSLATLRDCEVLDGAQNPVWVAEEGAAELTRCRLAGHRWPSIAMGPHARLRVADCEVVDNLDGGLHGADGSLLVVERTRVARNAGFGIELRDAAPASRVEDCTVEGNLGVGIGIVAGVGGSVLRCRVRGNEVGIVAVGGATPTIDGNEVIDNHTGIGVRGHRSDPLVVANTVSGSHDGVVIDEAATGRYERNRVSACEDAGVWVDDPGTRPRFEGNTVSGCGVAAVFVTDGGGGEFASNDLRGNAEGSWKTDEPGDLVRTGNLEDAGPPLGGRGAWPGGTPGRAN